ncbi:hypothetical protein AG0111_0g5165 [Alternaria gaisen]|uniref:Uncharacterized protein n=1 Tax=Alternaria gaisen TaxID=167740 RepID=A0ACB6FR96_9PLEO|nr:hypothetical protein AG0111_0g5165 [Alternaria gaisen]
MSILVKEEGKRSRCLNQEADQGIQIREWQAATTTITIGGILGTESSMALRLSHQLRILKGSVFVTHRHLQEYSTKRRFVSIDSAVSRPPLHFLDAMKKLASGVLLL